MFHAGVAQETSLFLPRILCAIALLGLAPVPSAHAASPPSQAMAAAQWAAAQLTDGSHVEGDFGPDVGLTADLILALAATGVSPDSAAAAGDWLEGQAASYSTGGVPKSVSAGATAKLVLVAKALERDPTNVAGLDLLSSLQARLQSNGRFTDSIKYGNPPSDFSTTFTQSLALLALAPAVPDSGVDFLVQSQCPDGGFPVFYPAAGQACESDTDGTGLAVQTLISLGRNEDAAPGVAWLLAHQAASGAFSSTGPGAVPNTNSTALAAQALQLAHETAATGQALAWLGSRQLGCSASATNRGALGYLDPIVDAASLRATVQAVPALAGVSLAQIRISAPHSSQEPFCGTAPSPEPSPTSSIQTPPATTEPSAPTVVRPTPWPTTTAQPPTPRMPSGPDATAPARAGAAAERSPGDGGLREAGDGAAAARGSEADGAVSPSPSSPSPTVSSNTAAAQPNPSDTFAAPAPLAGPAPSTELSSGEVANTPVGWWRRIPPIWGVGLAGVVGLCWVIAGPVMGRWGRRA